MATTSLNQVVIELQLQNNTLVDVKDSIKALLSEDQKRRKKEESNKGDKEELRREKSNAKAKARQEPAKGFKQGIAQGTGIASIGDMLRGFGGGAGLLGGATIGGIIGKGIGRLFFPALAAFFGAKYVDKWISPTLDKILGENATWEMFGKEFDASKLVAGLGVGLAALFSKKLIATAVQGAFFGKGDTKGPAIRKSFIGKLGLAAILGFAGDALGNYIGGLTGSEQMGEAISGSAAIAAAGLMFLGPKGAIVLGIAALVGYAGKALIDWMNKRRQETEQDLVDALAEANTKFQAARATGDTSAMAEAVKESERFARRLAVINSGKAGLAYSQAYDNQEVVTKLSPTIRNVMASARLGGQAAFENTKGESNSDVRFDQMRAAMVLLAERKDRDLTNPDDFYSVYSKVAGGFQESALQSSIKTRLENDLMSLNKTGGGNNNIIIGQLGNNSTTTSSSAVAGRRSGGGMGSTLDYHYLQKHSMQLGNNLYANAQLTF